MREGSTQERLEEIEKRQDRLEERVAKIEGQLGITDIGSEGVPTGGAIYPRKPQSPSH